LGYQKTLNISYADKFLNEIQKRFRDQYKKDLMKGRMNTSICCQCCLYFNRIKGGFNRSFAFRATYEQVLSEVEDADEEAKKMKRQPRSYDESDKKLKNVKIVTKKTDVQSDENKKKKKVKQLAASTKSSSAAVAIEEVDEENEDDEPMVTTAAAAAAATNDEPTAVSDVTDEQDNEDERYPLEEIQPTAMSIRDKMQAMGKKPAPFSRASARREFMLSLLYC
jgi:type I site-specific restriction-modification system R (restriction) subunit